ncbi:uncharacterized protein LOC133364485 isoform X2 [Rhineura floridana]|uniref:uncharacterized protein LOC133364485 isoform X2 n=1 Tax=Rhineura floridana TaxID=261503 RepID=UPI002AC834C4|nr:uncharacterized protein LOC133364485 isoform X2 [Rhineura floridana]XP_061441134.1 uncharacterized protein LOC133364485 isoform X2 [Rhineura floridana]XP_061441135.1 uncharacterized protein LOC133364485 isoform X2 [Rhineura floridana]XP_061441136.1 uncharacterized protein LOC133364485 isoform X2 [Rhineura floridana]XP_061441137.1 uncharacterized protein LOC133364485 isoform X2 [Rhineura floridana]XP_061441138.1 uncharacterized protein LOC133364485 isoform X2 [Rhineura floridana]XP_06144113
MLCSQVNSLLWRSEPSRKEMPYSQIQVPSSIASISWQSRVHWALLPIFFSGRSFFKEQRTSSCSLNCRSSVASDFETRKEHIKVGTCTDRLLKCRGFPVGLLHITKTVQHLLADTVGRIHQAVSVPQLTFFPWFSTPTVQQQKKDSLQTTLSCKTVYHKINVIKLAVEVLGAFLRDTKCYFPPHVTRCISSPWLLMLEMCIYFFWISCSCKRNLF